MFCAAAVSGSSVCSCSHLLSAYKIKKPILFYFTSDLDELINKA